MATFAVGISKELWGSLNITIPDEQIEGMSKRQIESLVRKKAEESILENGVPSLNHYDDAPGLVNGVRIAQSVRLPYLEAVAEEYNNPIKEYVAWGYDKDNDVWVEYYRGPEKDKALFIAIDKSIEMDSGNLVHECSDGSFEPIDWIEVVDSQIEICDEEDVMQYVEWNSQDNFISMDDIELNLKAYNLEGIEITEEDIRQANRFMLSSNKSEAIKKVLNGISEVLEEGYEK